VADSDRILQRASWEKSGYALEGAFEALMTRGVAIDDLVLERVLAKQADVAIVAAAAIDRYYGHVKAIELLAERYTMRSISAAPLIRILLPSDVATLRMLIAQELADQANAASEVSITTASDYVGGSGADDWSTSAQDIKTSWHRTLLVIESALERFVVVTDGYETDLGSVLAQVKHRLAMFTLSKHVSHDAGWNTSASYGDYPVQINYVETTYRWIYKCDDDAVDRHLRKSLAVAGSWSAA
jgi:hypothetical protein